MAISAVNAALDVVVGDAAEEARRFLADLAFLDLDGTEETTFRVLTAVRAPLVLAHDVCRQRCDGVERAIRRAGFRVVESVGTLALCERTPTWAAG